MKVGRINGVKAGGVYRVAFEQAFGFTDGFDPTGEYLIYSFAIESNLMVRTLVGYDHVAGPAGNRLVPDIATTVPRPTWTSATTNASPACMRPGWTTQRPAGSTRT